MKNYFWPSLIAILILLFGCSTSEKNDINTAEGAFERAQYFEKNERYDEAITQYMSVKNKHPYSKFSLEAELRVADIYFKQENYIEAESAYKLFKEFHPRHPKIDYVTFQLAMSYYRQLPKTPDRDLSLADKAISLFTEVIQSFPRSKYVAQAKKNKTECRKKLANKELYIADFYYIRDMYLSALGRFKYLLRNFPRLGFEPKALYGAAVSSYKIKELEKARSYYKRLVSRYPDSQQAKKIKNELRNELQ